MKSVLVCVMGICSAVCAPPPNGDERALSAGRWRAWLDSPGGELPFGIELRRNGGGWQAWLINGIERIDVPRVGWDDGGRFVIDIEHYDSRIVARANADGTRLDGVWTKTAGSHKTARLPFHATAGDAPRFSPGSIDASDAARKISGRWSIRFSSSDEPAVGVFEARPDGSVTGTIMTTTGDYRYLAGLYQARRLRLSCFDGAHAFLFDARLQPNGVLKGDFWSRDSWHETWTAHLDPEAELPDDFRQTRWTGRVPLEKLVFPDLQGRRRSLADPAFAGKARIIEVFGSWCPNCNDATAYLVGLDRRYRDRGLSIVALAFELTGDIDRDIAQVRKYVKRHGATYPVLIAGTADKDGASAVLPFLDRLRSYPTTIFTDAAGNIRAVHTGFTGPATGAPYDKLRSKFEAIVEEILQGADPSHP